MAMNLVFQFPDFQAFLWMKGHGPYVWGCYAVTFVAMAFLIIEPIVQRRQFIKEQQGLLLRSIEPETDV
jgi:heme exporter protein D